MSNVARERSSSDNGQKYNTDELARMKAMQIQWGWHECAVGKGKRTKAEKRALLAYYKTFGIFPPGLTVMIGVTG